MSIQPNERTAMAQAVTTQPDGPGLRIGKRGELVMIGNVAPGGAALFRERLPQFQAEAAYWEARVGTVHDFRILLFDNDTRYLLLLTYDGDFKPYLTDIATQAHPWLDAVADGVLENYPGLANPAMSEWVRDRMHQAEFFYVSNPDVSVRDIIKMKQLRQAFSDMLDSAA